MAQLLIEEAFTGGSLITSVSVSNLAELQGALSRFGTNECELRCRSQAAEPTSRAANLDALTDEDFNWLTQPLEGEQRTLVVSAGGAALADSASFSAGDAIQS